MHPLVGPEPTSQKERVACRGRLLKLCKKMGITIEQCLQLHYEGQLELSNNKKKQLRKMIAEQNSTID